MEFAAVDASSRPNQATWKAVASIPILFTFASLLQYHWGELSWSLVAGIACAAYSAYESAVVVRRSGAPVALAELRAMEGAWVAGNLCSTLGLMLQADDTFSLRYCLIVAFVTIVGLAGRLIPSVAVSDRDRSKV
jgi:hypothetical protein